MTARLATAFEDITLACERLKPAQFSPRHFIVTEGALVLEEPNGVMWCSVLRLKGTEPCIWVNNIVGARSTWLPMIRFTCEEAVRRDLDTLPVYRYTKPDSPLATYFASVDAQLPSGSRIFQSGTSMRPDGKAIRAPVTAASVLQALDKLAPRWR